MYSSTKLPNIKPITSIGTPARPGGKERKGTKGKEGNGTSAKDGDDDDAHLIQCESISRKNGKSGALTAERFKTH
ncbi:hypothetical protein N9L76_02650 [bacterium]|nr:hypothetical protein [bacterium]